MHSDWTAAYRLYSQGRVNIEALYETILKEALAKNTDRSPLITALDDSTLRKTGSRIPGVKYTRDPMGPPFSVNFVRGQRVIQMSAALSDDGRAARMIPVVFRNAPSASKPRKHSSPDAWRHYRQQTRQLNLSRHGVNCIADVREQMNRAGQQQRKLWTTVDGSYTNRNVLRNVPQNVEIIGRIRGDAKLFYLPHTRTTARGRARIYGQQAPTPEMVKDDEQILWQTVPAYAAGRTHDFRVKTVEGLRWRASGKHHVLRLIVIAPLRYRLTKGSKLLYRKPAYLIATDPHASLTDLLQAYLWRWDIEVNFRDEKTILGVGEAQVRNPLAVEAVPQMMVAAYSLLLLAAHNLYGLRGTPLTLPPPKWYRRNTKLRPSTMDLIKALRIELWGQAITESNLTHFVDQKQKAPKYQKNQIPLRAAVFYAAA